MKLSEIEELYNQVPYCKEWNRVKIKEITKGFSNEFKYLIENIDSENNIIEKVFIRISSIKLKEEKIEEFKRTKLLNSITDDFNMTRAIEMGVFEKNNNSEGYVWILTNWIEGTDFRDDLPKLPLKKQYELGLDAGRLLKLFHSLEIKDTSNIYNRDNIERKLRIIQDFENTKDIRFENDELIIKFIKENLDTVYKLDCQKLVLKHGDYHVGNMVLTDTNQFAVIDFNRSCYGFALDEFQRIQNFDIECSVHFSIGQIDGYFGNKSSEILNNHSFWYSFKTFVAMSLISGVHWARTFDQSIVDGMIYRAQEALSHFNNFKDDIPSWYLEFKQQQQQKEATEDIENSKFNEESILSQKKQLESI
ncbi:hypothetical protein DICPUDRAFT_147922 [Dictyostelium purpureum]|uniref:Aminoglycoside phosphotransferase domain-containing protein n=1 Tax=Dictyostelium purpureum TaxID=5786 RepID=F0Z9S1_DICPU|nr:uncharacterized protein DICPUDRAFT_147922 [Dictyostelium purpureum]EGC39258.1 hypothetical protein DICPUDRAFT_147922 [Dictyostelium purpureum]|eukprot:XP_003284162.1 hypothetical protein DICPUDRAFT_147922 [Dictyostelium purpureum]